uniref:Glutamate receptor n=1 Tax=Eptatretus burgeri TaxID=7764 RepID=A0A8C4Q6I3_EPTBU
MSYFFHPLQATESNLAAMDSHWVFVNEEINDMEVQALASAASGRLTVIRQSFPIARNASQRCIRNNHHISESLCSLGSGNGRNLEVSSRYVYDSVLLLANAFHRKLEDRKWHSMASLNCLRKSSKPWNGGRSTLDTIRKGRVSGLTGIMDFGEDNVNHNVQFEILGTSYSELFGRDVRRLASWDPGRGLNGTLRDLRLENNMNGVTLRIVTVLEEPFVMLSENVLGKPKRFRGFSIDVLDSLAQSLGFAYEIYMAPDHRYGNLESDGSWNGMIGELLHKKADVGISGITITPERESVVDFTKRYMDYSVGVLLHRPSDSPGLFALLLPIDTATWACLILAIAVVGLLFYLLNRITPRQDAHNTPSFSASLWLIYGSFTQQGPEVINSSMSSRMVLAVWWLFALIVVSSYTANLTALLTINRMDPPVRSLHDLARQSELQYGTVLDSSIYEHIRLQGLNPLAQGGLFAELWKVIGRGNGTENCVRDPRDGARRVSAGGYAFLWDTAVLEYMTLNAQHCTFITFPSTVYSKGYGLALQHGSPYRELFSQRILELQENGELAAMQQRWWPRVGKCELRGETQEPVSSSRALGLKSFAGVFCLLAAGLLLACVVAVLEIWWSRRHHRHRASNQDDKEMDMQQFHHRLNSLSLDEDTAHKQIGPAAGATEMPSPLEPTVGMRSSMHPIALESVPDFSHPSHSRFHTHAHHHPPPLPPTPPPISSSRGFLSEHTLVPPPGRSLPSKLNINLPLGSGCSSGPGEHVGLGTFKHRAPNGGIFRQSPMNPAAPIPFQSLSATIPEDPEETTHGTSI